jgi:hypothetical protein
MSQIVPDDGDIDAGLQQSNGTTVAHDMGSDVERTQVGQRFRNSVYILVKQVGNAIASQRNAAGISENGLVARVCCDDLTQRRRSFRPQWAETLFTTLAMQPHLPRTIEVKLPKMNGQGFAHSRSGVV